MSVKATECSELSGVMLKPVFLNPLLATAALFDILPLNLYLSLGVSKLLELYDISRQALFLFTRSVWRNDLWVNLHLTPYNLN